MVHGAMVNVYPVGNFIVHGRIVDKARSFFGASNRRQFHTYETDTCHIRITIRRPGQSVLPDLYWHNVPKRGKMYLSNDHKITKWPQNYQMAIHIPNGHKITK
jgi:hypothetical protein